MRPSLENKLMEARAHGLLDSVTPQQAFDAVVAHIALQGYRCVSDSNVCVYRGPRGTKCAIGALLQEAEYDKSFEGLGVIPLIARQPKFAARFSAAPTNLLERLQDVHDFTSVQRGPLRPRLLKIANDFDLSTELLDETPLPDIWQ